MRNEIFNQINQNRIQYYSELKSSQKEPKPKTDSITKENNNIEEDPIIPGTKFFSFQRFNKINFSLLKLVFSHINQQLNNVISQTTQWTRKINEYLTHKVTIQSNRFTDSLSRISSQLFEDSYEFQQHTDIPEHREQSVNQQTMRFSIINSPGASLAIPYQQEEFRLLDQFIEWLYTIYRNIIIFLESDNWFEEINRSQKSTKTSHTKHRTYSYERNNKRVELFIMHHSPMQEMNDPTIVDYEFKAKEQGDHIYHKITRKLKMLSSFLFPAINRFI